MGVQKNLTKQRRRRAWRVRGSIRGTADRPRLSVHRTNKHTYGQLIDDVDGRTIATASSLGLKLPNGGNVEAAKAVGEALGKKAAELKIEAASFDRGRFRYHGRVKAFAEAVRAAGVKF
jgi:large subunit ribosomal protein L18